MRLDHPLPGARARKREFGNEVSNWGFLARAGFDFVTGLDMTSDHDRCNVVGRRDVVLPDGEAELPARAGDHVSRSLIQPHSGISTGQDRRPQQEKYSNERGSQTSVSHDRPPLWYGT